MSATLGFLGGGGYFILLWMIPLLWAMQGLYHQPYYCIRCYFEVFGGIFYSNRILGPGLGSAANSSGLSRSTQLMRNIWSMPGCCSFCRTSVLRFRRAHVSVFLHSCGLAAELAQNPKPQTRDPVSPNPFGKGSFKKTPKPEALREFIFGFRASPQGTLEPQGSKAFRERLL